MTLRDHLEVTDPLRNRAPVRCACGRRCLPSEMIDVRALPIDVRISRCRETPAPVPEFLCAPCLEAVHGLELIDRVEVLERQGAPVEFCAWYAAKLERHPSVSGRPKKLSPRVEAEIGTHRAAFAAADQALKVQRAAEEALAQAKVDAEPPGL